MDKILTKIVKVQLDNFQAMLFIFSIGTVESSLILMSYFIFPKRT